MMRPVTRQPEENAFFRLPEPPTPPKTEGVSCDWGLTCCTSACVDGMFGCALGSGVGICLECCSAGTIASTHFPLGLCCAFGFTCCLQNLSAQAITKRQQLDHDHHQNLLRYNTQLRERFVMLSPQSDQFSSNQCQCDVPQPLNNLLPRVNPCVDNNVQHSAVEPPVKPRLYNSSLALAFVQNRFFSSRVPEDASKKNNV